MARQKKVSVKDFIPAVLSVAKSVAAGDTSAHAFTSGIAAKVGLSVADCETRYKRFASNKKYQRIFEKVAAGIGEIEFVTVGAQGAPRLSDDTLDSWLNDAENL